MTGAYGMVIASNQDEHEGVSLSAKGEMIRYMMETKDYLDSARPTAGK